MTGPACTRCHDTGHVCEEHPTLPWGAMCCDFRTLNTVTIFTAESGITTLCPHGACHCSAFGLPCPACCDPVPANGTHRTSKAFTPRPDRTRRG